MSSRPTVLLIAGTDSSGGAGLLRDAQVLAQFGVEARCAVTAVTAQSDTRVAVVHCLPPQLVAQQIRSALEADGIGAIKIGMLGTRATIEAVAESLPTLHPLPIVLDPVLASSSGGSLLEEAGLSKLRELMPLITLVTPNLPEAATLLEDEVATDEGAMLDQAQRLLRLGVHAVLIKGGHGAGKESVDILVTSADPPIYVCAPRLATAQRGTGCALSSAIAACLALGTPLTLACERAKTYVWTRLSAQNDNAAVR